MYKKLGVKITRVHQALKFDESAWLKPYIDLNTKLRASATNDADKDMYKLLNNAVFGKTCENLLGRTEYQLVGSRKQALKYISKPTFKDYTEYNETLAGIHLDPSKVILNKPSYVGIAVLELSKTLMYDFFYHNVKARYGSRAQLQMTDTDSLLLEIQTDDWYDDIRDEVKTLYDTSAYPGNHPAGLPRMNKKVIGLWKDEYKGRTVSEYAGTCSKSYALTLSDYPGMCKKNFCDGGCKEKNCIGNGGGKKCKGAKKTVVKKGITLEDYKKCVFNQQSKDITQLCFRTHDHEMFTEKISKVVLSPKDDKRVILSDGIRTLPIGHWRTRHKNLGNVQMNIKKLAQKGSLMNLALYSII